tara:strand:- start:8232 stop:9050 length:819 start_codon:yes stop_codon:yes gene_type:complete
MDQARQFYDSNKMVAKVAFLILVLVVFVIALRVGTRIMAWFFSPALDPYLIKGMIDGKQMMRIPQNPNEAGAIPILRSKDNRNGLVFTWSIWLFVDSLEYKEGAYKHIFHKGGDKTNPNEEGKAVPTNAPGLYIDRNDNKLIVIMNTFDKIEEEVVIPDFPMNKWMNIIIRVDEQLTLDVYMNGRLARRHQLSSPPRQNYGDVFMGMNGGFSGYSSCLRYFSSAIGTKKIQDIVSAGPCTQLMDTGNVASAAKPRYLSLRWFFTGQKDMYNP